MVYVLIGIVLFFLNMFYLSMSFSIVDPDWAFQEKGKGHYSSEVATESNYIPNYSGLQRLENHKI